MDLRSFLNKLGDLDELVLIENKVDTKFEAAGLINKISKDLDKATFLKNIIGHEIPIVGQVLGNYKRLAQYFGFNRENIIRDLSKRWGQKNFKIVEKLKTKRLLKSPCDLTKDLPIVTHSENDGGPYITGGVILAKDEQTDIYNLSYHRMQLIGPQELRVRIGPGHHLEKYFQQAQLQGKNLEVAILIGANPAIMVAGAASLSLEEDELKLASSLIDEPIIVAKAESVDLFVPVDTEIIIEGEILANIKRSEGPFGDWIDNYIPLAENNVFIPKVITLRENPIYYTMIAGSPEDVVLLGFSAAVSIFKNVQKVVPTIIDVACWPFPLQCILKIKKEYKGQGKQAALAAFGSNMHWLKYCTVVDEDVDIYSPRDIAWAMASRCCPDKDIFVIPNTPSFYRDPYRMHWGRLVVDATAPIEHREEYKRKRIPGESELQLKDYINRKFKAITTQN